MAYYKPQPEFTEGEPVDQWILGQLAKYTKEITAAFDKYNYAQARDLTDKFFWNDFTDRYLEFVKYRLYGDDANSKLVAQQTLYTVFLALLKFYAPIIPYITEELYQAYFKEGEKKASLHVTAWPEVKPEWQIAGGTAQDFEKVIELVDEIRKWKSDQGLSMGKEVSEYKPKTKIKDDYKDFVQQALRIKKLV